MTTKFNPEEEELQEFMKNVLPLMTIDDLCGCLVLKRFADKPIGVRVDKIFGIYCQNAEFQITIRKVKGGSVS